MLTHRTTRRAFVASGSAVLAVGLCGNHLSLPCSALHHGRNPLP